MHRPFPSPMGDLFMAPTGVAGLVITKLNGECIQVHNKDNPHSETKEFLDMVPELSTGIVILNGMGLGYSACALIKKRPRIRHLIVFEAFPEIFQQALLANDLSDLLQDPRLILCVGFPGDIHKLLSPAARALQLEDIHLLKHLPSYQLNPEFYKTISDQIFEVANAFNMEGNTMRAYGNLFIKNRFENLRSTTHRYLLEGLDKIFTGTPAIIVSGGPSLDKNIHLLPKAKDKAVILAVDTVLPALLKTGVTPNFVTSIDYKASTYEKISDTAPNADGLGISLICSSWVSPRVCNTFPAKNIFFTYTQKPMEQWLNKNMGGKQLISGASTVAHLNFIAASILGCSPIIFIGQDLALSHAKSHTDHTFLQSNDAAIRSINSKEKIEVPGIIEKNVLTNRMYLNMKIVFENMMSNTPNQYINSTEGGAHLEGAENMPFSRALAIFCKENRSISKKLSLNIDTIQPINTSAILKEFKVSLHSITKLFQLIDKADTIAKFVKKEAAICKKKPSSFRRFDSLPASLQNKILKLDDLHLKIDKYHEIWQLVEEATMPGLKESERMKQEAFSLGKEPERFLAWLDLNLNRLLFINKIRKEVLNDFRKNISNVTADLQNEKKFLKAIKREETFKDKLELLRLYMNAGNYVLAQPIANQLIKNQSPNAEVYYFASVIAAHRTEYDKMDDLMAKAFHLDENLQKPIAQTRQSLANQYLQYGLFFKDKDMNTSRKLLLKGLKYYYQQEIIEELECQAHKALDKDPPDITNWLKDLSCDKHLTSVLTPETLSRFYHLQGKLFLQNGSYKLAHDAFSKAISFQPQTPDLQIAMTETLFAEGDFDMGIQHLQKAVAINPQYAIYWEKLGDELQSTGQSQNAIYAYEQCFTSLPSKKELLKKMGDCYTTLNKFEAAKEAYSQYKNKF